MKAVVGIAALVAVALGASAASAALPAIAVQAPGVTCPSAQAVREALARLSPAPATDSTRAFRLTVERAPTTARVELRDLTGRPLLVRQLPVTATDCKQAAEAIALIVERHFRALEWSPAGGQAGTAPSPAAPPPGVPLSARPTTPPPLPAAPVVANQARSGAAPPTLPAASAPAASSLAPAPSPPVPAVPTAPAAPPPGSPPPDAAPSPPEPGEVPAIALAARRPSSIEPGNSALPRLALGAGPAFWTRGSTFGVALGARWRILADGPFEVGASVLLPPGQTSTALGSGGTVHLAAVPVTASLGLAGALGRLAVGLHAAVLWTIERGQSESILAPATAWRTVLGGGLGVSAAWPVAARLRLTGAFDGYRAVLGRSYAISGVPGTVLDPSPWQAIFVLGAEWVVSP